MGRSGGGGGSGGGSRCLEKDLKGCVSFPGHRYLPVSLFRGPR